MSTALLRRRGAARVSGVLGVCALVSTGVVVSSTAASAEEETVTGTLQTFAAEAFAPQADELPTGLVEAIQRDLGISAEEYLANAAAAKVAADVSAQLVDAGVNINATVIDGQDVTLYVEAEADVAAAEAVGAKVEIGLPEVNSDETEEQEYFAQDDFKGGYGYGTLDDFETPTGAYRCSAGFNGTAGDGSPVNYTAGHCGYEFEDGHPWFHIPLDGPLFDSGSWVGDADTPPPFLDRPLGENGPMHFGAGEDGLDGGLLNITEPGWTTPPQVAVWGGGTGAPDDGAAVNIYDSTDAVVGQPACKSGATSGWTCGEVLWAEDTVELSTAENVTAFIFTACMLSGDSGGSIVSGNYALGVNSFSNAQSDATCDSSNWNPATVFDPETDGANGNLGGGFAVTSGTANAETVFGDDFNLAIHVGTPAVTSPEDGGTTDQTPTISGSVEAAAGATVTVEIEGGPTVEGTVAADGTWSADVDEELAPGTYTYTATASHTANGASEATTSDATTGSFEVVEQQVEDLAVDSPTEGQTTGNARPEFSGAGQPGATVALTVGDAEYGTAEVGEDGAWTLTPSSDLPVGVRFDAVVTQTFEDDTQKVTVADLGIEAADVTITTPEDGSTVAGDVVFEGTSFAGASIGLLLEQAADAAADDAQPRLGVRAEGEDDVEEWAGEFEIDDAGNWTFDPAEDLPEGEYTITATATLEGGDPELSDSEAVATFTVANGGGDDDGGNGEDGDEDLPDTGSSGTTWMIVGGIALLLAGGAAVAVRARRNTTA
ncbi:Ig-like domain-containing protein [Jiangella rhizosphaerae]|uniref:LPXTG cell wall anchor domain-containing protein n=1 Tax=Jiangella rhizosphaerae TaxID=2293569 RepID=A0A418KSX8_9ACTN|nr:Ig-like domain-containing protein [Jiangella rhizosphaerae]RIQ27341.1 LPXTG cell wall anchor domain-containing protein [Jiangella rhizosphaerae]